MNTKTILIIGANSDIAKEIAKIYIKKNYNIYLFSRNKSLLESFEDQLFIKPNIEIVEFTKENNENFSLILNNLTNKPDTVIIANGFMGDNKIFSITKLREIFEINFFDVIEYSEICIEYFKKNKIEGNLAVFCSVSAIRGRAKNFFYGSAKSALLNYLSGLRQKNSKNKISITSIILGFVDTKMLRNSSENYNNFLIANPKRIAKKIVLSIDKKKDFYYPIIWRIIMFIIKLIPEKIFKKLNF